MNLSVVLDGFNSEFISQLLMLRKPRRKPALFKTKSHLVNHQARRNMGQLLKLAKDYHKNNDNLSKS